MDFSFKKRSFVVITGASRGIGKSIALQFSERFPDSSVFVLMARNVNDLEKTKMEMQAILPNITVFIQYFDQENIDQGTLDYVFKNILSENKLDTDMFEQSIIVHNAGMLGDVPTLAKDMFQLSTLKSVVDTNFIGMVLLNSTFFKLFRNSSRSRMIINISSCAAILPLPLLGVYCPVKAARDMHLRVLVKETPSIKALTYHPGAVDTEMYNRMVDDSDGKYPEWYNRQKAITPNATVATMIKTLEDNTYENGVTVCGDGTCSQYIK